MEGGERLSHGAPTNPTSARRVKPPRPRPAPAPLRSSPALTFPSPTPHPPSSAPHPLPPSLIATPSLEEQIIVRGALWCPTGGSYV
ncbi:hypothetical protein E2C01_065529 [Portunus trituberculatus]|uniref:Uncharacterized protein n=1 Tax=Portunus trituberculatus TaxID=210409 RepID=A0A5B7HRC2_PORTR|nr:hypothetical protein [Portunus trituberculatus]